MLRISISVASFKYKCSGGLLPSRMKFNTVSLKADMWWSLRKGEALKIGRCTIFEWRWATVPLPNDSRCKFWDLFLPLMSRLIDLLILLSISHHLHLESGCGEITTTKCLSHRANYSRRRDPSIYWPHHFP